MKEVLKVAEKKIKKKPKKKVSLAAIGIALIGAGTLSIQQGDATAGVILIIIGLAVIVATKYIEE